jgi:hypothetical protein
VIDRYPPTPSGHTSNDIYISRIQIKILSEVDLTEFIINITENQVRLRAGLKALIKKFEEFKHKALELD